MIDWDEWDDRERDHLAAMIELVDDIVDEKLARIRLGVYSEEQDGSVQEILEEIERVLR